MNRLFSVWSFCPNQLWRVVLHVVCLLVYISVMRSTLQSCCTHWISLKVQYLCMHKHQTWTRRQTYLIIISDCGRIRYYRTNSSNCIMCIIYKYAFLVFTQRERELLWLAVLWLIVASCTIFMHSDRKLFFFIFTEHINTFFYVTPG